MNNDMTIRLWYFFVKVVLHTGDFRFCSDMTKNEAIKACKITTLILDTTYCDPQVRFAHLTGYEISNITFYITGLTTGTCQQIQTFSEFVTQLLLH